MKLLLEIPKDDILIITTSGVSSRFTVRVPKETLPEGPMRTVLIIEDNKDNLTIIAITSYAMTGDRERILAAGCNGYFEKLIDPITIVEQIHKILGKMGN